MALWDSSSAAIYAQITDKKKRNWEVALNITTKGGLEETDQTVKLGAA